MKAINIKWDTNGDKKLLETLPKEMEIPQELVEAYTFDPYIGIEYIEDWMSATTGYCYTEFSLED